MSDVHVMKDRKGKRSPNFFLMVKTVQEIFFALQSSPQKKEMV